MDRIIILTETSDRLVLQVTAVGEAEALGLVNEWIEINEIPSGIVERILSYSGETPEKPIRGSRSEVLGLYYYYQIIPNRAGALTRTIKLDQV